MPSTINYRGHKIDRSDMEAVFELFDAYQRADFPWWWWRRWAIEFNGRHYPPKECMRVATGIKDVERGGTPMNRWYTRLGFTVVDTYRTDKSLSQLRYANTKSNETEKETTLKTRIGQGVFRNRLLKQWESRCSVTGCEETRLLRASHILPWSKCNNEQRLNPNNGLLLIPNLDLAFDQGLISFQNDGLIIISDQLNPKDRVHLGLNNQMRLRETNHERLHYIAIHRNLHNK